jgi:hypothetical protein
VLAHLMAHGLFAGRHTEDAAEPFDLRLALDPSAAPSLADDRPGGLALALGRRMARIEAPGRRVEPC